jgi:hypothetical protein
MVLVDFIGIFFTFPNTFDRCVYIYILLPFFFTVVLSDNLFSFFMWCHYLDKIKEREFNCNIYYTSFYVM